MSTHQKSRDTIGAQLCLSGQALMTYKNWKKNEAKVGLSVNPKSEVSLTVRLGKLRDGIRL
jgi:hypothetical protein